MSAGDTRITIEVLLTDQLAPIQASGGYRFLTIDGHAWRIQELQPAGRVWRVTVAGRTF